MGIPILQKVAAEEFVVDSQKPLYKTSPDVYFSI